jgi:hypothetical protein
MSVSAAQPTAAAAPMVSAKMIEMFFIVVPLALADLQRLCHGITAARSIA